MTKGGGQEPTTALASIFVDINQLQHTLTAIFGGCRRIKDLQMTKQQLEAVNVDDRLPGIWPWFSKGQV